MTEEEKQQDKKMDETESKTTEEKSTVPSFKSADVPEAPPSSDSSVTSKEDKYREEISSEEVEKYMRQRTSTSAERPKINTDVAPKPVQKHTENAPAYNSHETKTSSINPLRTYKDDVARTMSRKKTSLARMVIAESKRRLQESKAHEEKSSRNIKKTIITVISALLIVSGVASASYFYIKNKRGSVIQPAARISSLIFAEAQEEFDVTGLKGNQIMSLLTTERDRAGELSLGSIKHLYLTENMEDGKRAVDAREFLQTISTHVRPSYLRSLNSPFMLGFHVFNGSQPFLILKVGFFEGAFAGMLEWEEFMREDLSPLFGQAYTPISAVIENTPPLQNEIPQPALPNTAPEKELVGLFAIGIESDQVKLLQQMLSKDAAIYPEGIISGRYGEATKRAVERFQLKYGIVSDGTPETTGFGLAGPITRKKLNEVFGRKIETASSATTTNPIVETPSSATIAQQTFVDAVIKNKDARVLKDETGNTILLYSFIDRETLVITTDENTFTEIFTRMTSGRVSR